MRPNKFLQLLKTQGPLTAKAVAEELGITSEGARQQLVRLSEEGLVKTVSSSKGVGRPVQVYELSEQGNASFPNNHAALTVELLNTIKEKLGDEALSVIISSRETETIKRYRETFRDCNTLEELIAEYVRIRSQEGYMADYRREGDHFILFELHCPIEAAACTCHGFCESDLRILKQLLGESVSIERTDHIAAGENRCAYMVREIQKDPQIKKAGSYQTATE